MKSLLASVRSVGGLDRVDHAVQLLEDDWRKHGEVPLERHWAEQRRLLDPEPGGSLVLLAELIRTDLRCRFARGQTPSVAGYLDRFPELEDADSRVLSLIYEEFCLTEERGDRVDVDAFCDRYPRWKDSLVSQLQYHHLFSQAAGVRPKATPFPEPGDAFEEFQLVSLLGRGGTSRVFLARDLSLGGKQVVLKVSLDRGREPQAQGALDHPHIVPVNSVVFGDEGMRGLSMPYRPGLPLDEVIRRVDPASRPRSAMALWQALVKAPEATPEASEKPEPHAGGEAPPPSPRGDGWEGFPVRGTYAQGVAWVVKVVADALHYAHTQQTFHRDVKPANILLTLQHGPQLLDFNLAESPHSASQAQAAMHGGTLPYMAPEQIAAFLDPDLWGKVGAQADIYSLGLVLRELLTGQAPDLPAETLAPARAMRVLLDRRPLLDVSVRRSNPTIPHALEAIVAKCLKVAVEDRYPDAGALADDLGRFLTRRPLLHAVNPSPRERCWNWAIRNRAGVAAVAISLALVLLGMVVENSRARHRPRYPIDSNPHLFAAMSALDARNASESLSLLTPLVIEYPHSSIPGVYLALTYEALGKPIQADHCLNDALGMPNAGEELGKWSHKDVQFVDRLLRFVRRRFLWAERLPEQGDGDDEDGREPTKDDVYRLTMRASAVLGVIRPDPAFSEYELALSLQELKEYDSVISRATEAIKSPSPGTTRDGAEQIAFMRQVYEWRRLRARALTKSAEHLRDEGADDRGSLKKALDQLSQALQDLDGCTLFISNQMNNKLDLHGLQKIRIKAMMTRVEIDLDLRDLEAARSHLKSAKGSLQKWEVPASLIDRSKDLEPWYDRLRQLQNRFDEATRESLAKGRS